MGSLGYAGLWRSGRLAMENKAEGSTALNGHHPSRSLEMSSGENSVDCGGRVCDRECLHVVSDVAEGKEGC